MVQGWLARWLIQAFTLLREEGRFEAICQPPSYLQITPGNLQGYQLLATKWENVYHRELAPKTKRMCHLSLLPQLLPVGSGGHKAYTLCLGYKRAPLLLERWGLSRSIFYLHIQVQKNSKQSTWKPQIWSPYKLWPGLITHYEPRPKEAQRCGVPWKWRC